jgi:GNAT superfamily N-acetyltransferase
MVCAFDMLREHNAGAGGARRRFGAVVAIASGHPVAYFNPVMALDPRATAPDTVAAIDWIGGLDLPSTVRLGDGVDPAIAVAVAARGLVGDEKLETVMVLEPIPAPPPAPAGVRIRAGAHEIVEDWYRALEAGPGLRLILNPAFVADPRVRIAVADVDGDPVAAAAAIRWKQTLGVYAVATVERARRRGYGRAVTWAAIDAGRRAWGSSIAVLQSTAMGVPVYASMGFEAIGSITRMYPPPG